MLATLTLYVLLPTVNVSTHNSSSTTPLSASAQHCSRAQNDASLGWLRQLASEVEVEVWLEEGRQVGPEKGAREVGTHPPRGVCRQRRAPRHMNPVRLYRVTQLLSIL